MARGSRGSHRSTERLADKYREVAFTGFISAPLGCVQTLRLLTGPTGPVQRGRTTVSQKEVRRLWGEHRWPQFPAGESHLDSRLSSQQCRGLIPGHIQSMSEQLSRVRSVHTQKFTHMDSGCFQTKTHRDPGAATPPLSQVLSPFTAPHIEGLWFEVGPQRHVHSSHPCSPPRRRMGDLGPGWTGFCPSRDRALVVVRSGWRRLENKTGRFALKRSFFNKTASIKTASSCASFGGSTSESQTALN